MQLYFGLLVFLGYMVYDTQEIIERAHHGDMDYIKHALTLFTDFVAVLVRVLVIMVSCCCCCSCSCMPVIYRMVACCSLKAACSCSNLAAQECPGEIPRGQEEEEALLNGETKALFFFLKLSTLPNSSANKDRKLGSACVVFWLATRISLCSVLAGYSDQLV